MKVVEENVIENETKTNLENLIKERVNKNRKIFNENETKMILTNIKLISKVYLLGLLDNKI